MTKHKVIKHSAVGMRFNKGSSVVMDDGWRGKVEHVDGDTVVCIKDGERPNDWLRGYRAFNRRSMTVTIDGSKATVNWMSASAATSATTGRRQRSAAVDLDRARRECEWESAPAY